MEECKWVQDEEDVWNTDCGNNFIINEGSPIDNNMKYCCYCGKQIKTVLFEQR